MRRRELLVMLGGAAAMWAVSAHAQQSGQAYRIAIVHPADPTSIMSETSINPNYRAFFEELRRLGYKEGENLVVERYSGEGHTDRHAELARQVVGSDPDAIYVISVALIRAFKDATNTIPMVAFSADPVGHGFATSLARPGGNITGITIDAGLEILAKRIELLKEALPATSKVAFLSRRDAWEGSYGPAMQSAAQRMGLSLVGLPLSPPIGEREYRRAFTAIAEAEADALIVSDAAENYTHRQLIVELAGNARLPAVYAYRDFAELGGLMAYAVNLLELNRRAAAQIDRILRGKDPAEMPFYQPTKFELILNLRTAEDLGLTLPASILARADEVIE